MGMGSRSLCRRSPFSTLVHLCCNEGIGTSSGCSVHQVWQTLQIARDELEILKEADLLICSYPYALCPILAAAPGLEQIAMLILVNGAGTLTEYAHMSLMPWILSTYKRWVLDGGLNEPLRRVIFNDRLDPVIARAAFGEQARPRFVDFGARYVLQLAGGVRCDLRARTAAGSPKERRAGTKLLVSRPFLKRI